jgi:hypothetical protein
MTSTPKQFRVWLVEWVSYSSVLEAESSDAAKAKAIRAFDESGTDGFKCHESGLEYEGIVVDELPYS